MVSKYDSWNGSSTIIAPNFGTGGLLPVETFGQTFKAPSSNLILDSVTFWIKDGAGTRPISFNGYLYAWNGSAASGSQLNTVTSSYTIANGSGLTAYTLNFGGVSLDPTKTYVAFAEATGNYPFPPNLGSYSSFAGNLNSYSSGQFVYSDNGGNLNNITQNWTTVTLGADLIFTAKFTAVPEPSTYALLGSGSLLCLVALRRRRSSRLRAR